MSKAQEYRIVEGKTTSELMERVNGLLSLGWKVAGSLTITSNQYSTIYYQTIYRDYEQPGAWG